MKDAQADSGAANLLLMLEAALGRASVLRVASPERIRSRENQLFDESTCRTTESGARLIHLRVQLERARSILLEAEPAPLPAKPDDSEEHAPPDDVSEETPIAAPPAQERPRTLSLSEALSDTVIDGESDDDDDTEDSVVLQEVAPEAASAMQSADADAAQAAPAEPEPIAPVAEEPPVAAEPVAAEPLAVEPVTPEPEPTAQAVAPAPALTRFDQLPRIDLADLDDEVPEPDEMPDLSGLLEKVNVEPAPRPVEPTPIVPPAPAPAPVAAGKPAEPPKPAPLAALAGMRIPPPQADEEATLVMSTADIRSAMARAVGGDLATDEPVPGSESPDAAELRELDESDLLIEDDERLDEPVGEPARPVAATPAPDAAPPRAGLFDAKGNAVLPTIRDPRDHRPAAAAIQLTPDGQARAVGVGLDYFDEVKVALPPVEDEETYEYDDGQGLAMESQAEDDDDDSSEYDGDDEDGALEISETEAVDRPVDLGAMDIRPVDDVDPVQIRELGKGAQRALDQGDLALAATFFSDLLDLSPNSIDAYLGRGRCYLDLGDFAAAMSDFQKAEDLDPNGPEPLVAMGELFAARRDYGRAIEFFDHAIALAPKHAMARCRRGICHYYKKSYRPAWLDLSDAERLDPNIPNIKQYVGMAKKKLEGGSR